MTAAARAEPLMTRGVQPTPTPRRPAGEVVWIHLGGGQPPDCAVALAARIAEERPGTGFVVTTDTPEALRGELTAVPRPADFPRAVRSFLRAAAPDALVWIGGPLWPVLAAQARLAGLPMLLANAGTALTGGFRGISGRDLVRLFDAAVATDADGGAALERCATGPVAALGQLQRARAPLEHDDAERARIAAALGARPVWYAGRVVASEVARMLTAHAIARQASHRLLLVLQPADPGTAVNLDARRSSHEVPPDGSGVFVADRAGEEGLWLRLAAISFIGGTLAGAGAQLDPFAAAALGSAITHGPALAPFDARFGALAEAHACRSVTGARDLGRTLAELISPDAAAALAHSAWSVVSDGAEATDHVAERVVEMLDTACA